MPCNFVPILDSAWLRYISVFLFNIIRLFCIFDHHTLTKDLKPCLHVNSNKDFEFLNIYIALYIKYLCWITCMYAYI